jgi:hypothetical protein
MHVQPHAAAAAYLNRKKSSAELRNVRLHSRESRSIIAGAWYDPPLPALRAERIVMLPAPSRLRPFANDEALAALAAPHSDRAAAVTAVAASATHRLNWLECGFGFLVLLSWLSLFGGGIIVDTEPYRRAISTSGVDALNVEGGRAGGSGAAAAMRWRIRPRSPLPGSSSSAVSCR